MAKSEIISAFGPKRSATAMKLRAVRSVQPNSSRSQGPKSPCGSMRLTAHSSSPTSMMPTSVFLTRSRMRAALNRTRSATPRSMCP
jgi:hypothetical protein